MQNIALSWEQSAGVAVALAATGVAMRFTPVPWIRKASAFAIEATVIAALYSLWQLAGKFSVMGTQHAFARAEWIGRFEHRMHLPSERSVEDLLVGHPFLAQTENVYYAVMHFGIMFVFLLWLFARHRDRYAGVRNVLALTSLGCLAIQLVPVAPPRLLAGYTDVAAQYGQSLYYGLAPDVLSAMPSVHVAWAVLVGWYVVQISSSPWRWIAAVHAAVTVFVVVSTGNHWWLDGIVGTAVLIASAWTVAGIRRAVMAVGGSPANESLDQTGSRNQPNAPRPVPETSISPEVSTIGP